MNNKRTYKDFYGEEMPKKYKEKRTNNGFFNTRGLLYKYKIKVEVFFYSKPYLRKVTNIILLPFYMLKKAASFIRLVFAIVFFEPLVGIFVLGLFGIISYLTYTDWIHEKSVAKYEKKLNTYIIMPNIKCGQDIDIGELYATLKAKGVYCFLPIDMNRNKVDFLYQSFSSECKSKLENDVDYSILIDREKIEVGRYYHGHNKPVIENNGFVYKAYKIRAHVTLCDVKKRIVLAQYYVYGREPNQTIKNERQSVGEDPFNVK